MELEARIYLEENNSRFPDLVHVPFSITPDAVLPDGFVPSEESIHFIVPNSRPLRS